MQRGRKQPCIDSKVVYVEEILVCNAKIITLNTNIRSK
jgi:hypothetical protein